LEKKVEEFKKELQVTFLSTGYCVSVNEENVVLITGSCAAKAPGYNKFFSEKFSLTGKHVCEVKETI
jgi:hypothetical protein